MNKSIKQKACAAFLIILTTTAGSTLLSPGAAHASKPCNYDTIVINDGGGAEKPSIVYGHKHRTGNHYIKSHEDGVWEYWADNNGGFDGDTEDTFYGKVQC